jgi:hypothetical protein
MDQRHYTHIQHVRAATHAQLRESVDTLMPASPAATFWGWALEPGTAQCEDWLQLMGVNQLAILTIGLLDGLIAEEQWDALIPHAARLNTYLTYEVVSDNLAIGCAAPGLPAIDARRTTLARFNTAVIARLADTPHVQPDVPWLVPSAMPGISLADQSLTAPHLRAMLAAFQRDHPEVTGVEHDLWPLLIANGETARHVASAVQADPFHDLVVSGLIARYAGVNRLLDSQDATWEERLSTGRDTILVQPVLAYYAALLQTTMAPEPLDAHAIAASLQQAAVLVRLLNDVGTPLLEMTDRDRAHHIQQFRFQAYQTDGMTLRDLLRDAAEPAVWTRLLKDLQYGEWNLAIDAVPASDLLAAQLDSLELHLSQAARSYAMTQETFAASTMRLKHSGALAGQIATMAERFVQFHRALYQQLFTSATGEYASAGAAVGVGG